MRHGILLAGITILWFTGLNIVEGASVTMDCGLGTGGNFHQFQMPVGCDSPLAKLCKETVKESSPSWPPSSATRGGKRRIFDPSHYWFFHQNLNAWTFYLDSFQILVQWSLHNFANDTTTVLSWHVQKFVVIWWLVIELQQYMIWIARKINERLK